MFLSGKTRTSWSQSCICRPISHDPIFSPFRIYALSEALSPHPHHLENMCLRHVYAFTFAHPCSIDGHLVGRALSDLSARKG